MRGLKKAIVLGVLLGALGMNGTANAIEKLRPKNKPKPVKALTKEEFATLRSQLGACIVKKNEAKVKAYLQHSDSATVDYKAMGTDPMQFMFYFRMTDCMQYNVPQMMQPVFMTPGGLRNLLLEAAYLEEFKSKPAPLLDANGQPSPSPVRSFASKDTLLPPATAFAAIADCTAAKGYDLADAVVRTPISSPEERQAAVALAPVIGTCVPEGENISLTPASIRALAADGLWQRYGAATTAQAAK